MITIDWNATAAWIALAVAIITPAVTSCLNNRHQQKMYDLKRMNDRIDMQNAAISSAISGIGLCLANPTADNVSSFGERFHAAYAYIPECHWDELNAFFSCISDRNLEAAKASCSDIVMLLASSYTTEAKGSLSSPERLSYKTKV